MEIRGKRVSFKKLWIMLLLTISTQCLWITSYAQETAEIIPQKNYNLSKCLEIKTNVPYITSHYGIMINEMIGEKIQNFISEMDRTVQEYQIAGHECNYPLEFMADYTIGRNDEKVLSFYMEYYQFAGGAHGMTYREPYTVNKNNGEVLGIKDLFNEGYNYTDKINEYIKSEINKDKEKYFDGGADFKGITNKTPFYLSGESLVIVYGLYEIAPYASGIIEFKINLNNFKDGLKYDNI